MSFNMKLIMKCINENNFSSSCGFVLNVMYSFCFWVLHNITIMCTLIVLEILLKVLFFYIVLCKNKTLNRVRLLNSYNVYCFNLYLSWIYFILLCFRRKKNNFIVFLFVLYNYVCICVG